jgi:hypothetical protein
VIPERELDRGLTTLKIMWIAMLGSLAVYLLVAHQTGADWQPALDGDKFAKLRVIIYLISLVNLFLPRYVKRRVLSTKARPKKPPAALGHLMTPLLGLAVALSGKGRGRSSPLAFENAVLQKYVSATILTLATYESIGIYGLVLFYLGKSTVDLCVLVLVSAVAMVFNRPNRDELIRLSQAEEEDSAASAPSDF